MLSSAVSTGVGGIILRLSAGQGRHHGNPGVDLQPLPREVPLPQIQRHGPVPLAGGKIADAVEQGLRSGFAGGDDIEQGISTPGQPPGDVSAEREPWVPVRFEAAKRWWASASRSRAPSSSPGRQDTRVRMPAQALRLRVRSAAPAIP